MKFTTTLLTEVVIAMITACTTPHTQPAKPHGPEPRSTHPTELSRCYTLREKSVHQVTEYHDEFHSSADEKFHIDDRRRGNIRLMVYTWKVGKTGDADSLLTVWYLPKAGKLIAVDTYYYTSNYVF